MSTRAGRSLIASISRPRGTTRATAGVIAQLIATIALMLPILVAGTAVGVGIAGAQDLTPQDRGLHSLGPSFESEASLILALLLAAIIAMALLSTVAVRLADRGRR